MRPYSLECMDGRARCGRFETKHGPFETPQFMPIGTRGSVKGVDVERLREIGTQILLVNTYHLWLRPGPETIRALGGIHGFTAWRGPILSDSGGFQVFSLKNMVRLSDEGVEFRSHLDGSRQFLSPEKSTRIQEELGVDIAMALDECTSPGLTHEEVEESLYLTIRWAKRSLAARQKQSTCLFGITQGGVFRDLRTWAAEELGALDFDGLAVGGLSVGEPKDRMYEVLDYHVQQLPSDKIRYLMGVGTPRDIIEAVHCGVDLFDCVIPTRAGRFGRAYVRGERPFINLKNAEHSTQDGSLDSSCSCLACRNYSRGYISHLFKVGEMLGPQLLTIHNLTHYLELMQRIRQAIRSKEFEAFYQAEKKRWLNVEAEDISLD